MKRRIFGLLFCFIILLCPRLVRAEEIQSFDIAIDITREGTIRVVETIEYDFGNSQRHGIFRTIPFTKKNEDGKKFQLDFSKISVTDGFGKKYPVSQSNENEFIKLKIGDPNKTITGVQRYAIFYNVSGALTYFSDHVELYWNATGNDWEVPINRAAATIKLLDTPDMSLVDLTCYTGVRGSTANRCIATKGSPLSFRTGQPLEAGEGLTLVVGFPRGIVSVLEPKPYITFWDTPLGRLTMSVLVIFFVLFVICWYIVYPVWLIVKWYQYGRDPKPRMGVTSAWFSPPKTNDKRSLTPAETGTLVDEHVDMRDISATIVDLARRGYIRIIENKKKDFTLELTKETEDNPPLQEFEKKLIGSLFKEESFLKLKGADLVKEIEEVKKIIYEAVIKEGFFPENPQKIRTFYEIIAVASFITMNIPLWFVALVFGRSMPRKTLPGAQEAAVAKSLKNFLASQDEKLEFQAKNQIFFEKLLPYAVAFGVEKIWAQRFADITMKQPNWYVGSTGGRFYSTSFVGSLNSSFASVTSAATPTRSSSGFSSGFSGGSSGGGGGGGGGGSW